jgi:hypothetical protein
MGFLRKKADYSKKAFQWWERETGFESILAYVLLALAFGAIGFGQYWFSLAGLESLGLWAAAIASGVLSYILSWRVSHLFIKNAERVRAVSSIVLSLLISNTLTYTLRDWNLSTEIIIGVLIFSITMIMFYVRVLADFWVERSGLGFIGRWREGSISDDYVSNLSDQKSTIAFLEILTKDEKTYEELAPLVKERSFGSLKDTLEQLKSTETPDKQKIGKK